MYGEAKKLQLIEAILKIEDEEVLSKVEQVISKSKMHAVKRKDFNEYAGMMTDEEATNLENIIAEGCENIYTDDWK